MQLISKLLDDNHGLAFQAIKKIQESLRLSPDRAERELLGAINYIAGMIIFLRARAKTQAKPKTDPFDMDKLQRAIFVPLKQYNELLAQYTQLERRLQELN